jgi:hypothetical protein
MELWKTRQKWDCLTTSVLFAHFARLAAFHFAQRARWAAAIRLRAAADMVLRLLPGI